MILPNAHLDRCGPQCSDKRRPENGARGTRENPSLRAFEMAWLTGRTPLDPVCSTLEEVDVIMRST